MELLNIKNYVTKRKESLKKHSKGASITIFQVGDNLASERYVRNKIKDMDEVGIKHRLYKFDDNISPNDFYSKLSFVCTNSEGAVMVQLPLPPQLDIEIVKLIIPPRKDVDGFNANSYFKPCTPLGIMNYLTAQDINLDGINATVIGRSDIVGKPTANMLTNANATVTLCHSHTNNTNLKFYTQHSDLIVSAVGKRGFITKDMISDHTIVIDVGINFDGNNHLCGDCVKDLANSDKDIQVTPVPCGVGLLTRLTLLENIIKQKERITNEWNRNF